MNEDFNPDELQPVPYRQDTELMLGPWQLGGLFLALVFICGICYFAGYSAGKHTARNLPVNGPPQGTPVAQTAGSGGKPIAGPQTGSRPRTATNVHPALEGDVSSSVPDLPPSASQDTTPVLMVQVAAVSHQEDADVLVSALRKHGYTVNVRRDPADGLIHVRIGPFTSRIDADATRQKLLGDGYNANVQP
jgi:cell division septation protein DedD